MQPQNANTPDITAYNIANNIPPQDMHACMQLLISRVYIMRLFLAEIKLYADISHET